MRQQGSKMMILAGACVLDDILTTYDAIKTVPHPAVQWNSSGEQQQQHPHETITQSQAASSTGDGLHAPTGVGSPAAKSRSQSAPEGA